MGLPPRNEPMSDKVSDSKKPGRHLVRPFAFVLLDQAREVIALIALRRIICSAFPRLTGQLRVPQRGGEARQHQCAIAPAAQVVGNGGENLAAWRAVGAAQMIGGTLIGTGAGDRFRSPGT